ncbi:transmembrane protein 17B-like isoform X2 [Pyxicephalus adspersus]|uniref:transmembrane protein 17B-like isoform X2 n=1 Tax=Pyxicephalus adspersus TaxID=30357 RepID=UPI003B5C5DF4
MSVHTPLPRNVRHGLASISGSLFIQNKTTDCGEHQSYHKGHEVMSSIPLQMALYFNVFFFPIWFMSEIIMLELKVPELAGFLLLTLLIQMPLFLFLLTDEKILILPLEFAVRVIYVIFLNMELLVSFFVLRIMTRQLATQFYLHQTDDLENKIVPAKCSQVTIHRIKRSMIELQETDALMY